MRLFDFSSSSGATVFGVPVYGRSNSWWHRWLVRPVYRAGNAVHKTLWQLRYRVVPQHRYHLVDTGLRPGYYDVDKLMLHACASLLVRYVEDEMGGLGRLDEFSAELTAEPDPNAPEGLVEGQVLRQNEAAALYRWWTVDRPLLKENRREMLDALYGDRNPLRTVKDEATGLHRLEIEPDTKPQAALRELLNGIEERIDREEQEFLHRLVDIRRSLWT